MTRQINDEILKTKIFLYFEGFDICNKLNIHVFKRMNIKRKVHIEYLR